MNDQDNQPKGLDGEQEEKIEDIMRARDRLDKILQEKFVKRMTIVFTDVCGYTKYMDTRGDIAGRAWMQKHNDIVLPLLEKHNGKVLTLMGDGVMSSFEVPEDAVKACIDIQHGLAEYNQTTDPADALHVTIGINSGEILMDSDHIAGDVVNMASRIETKADPDQILISKSTYDDVRGSTEILCRRHGSVKVKGKEEPLELYRVIWQHQDTVVTTAPMIRSRDAWTDQRAKKRPSVLHLEVNREDNRLKISAFEQQPGEITTVRQYEDIPIPIEKINNHCHEIVNTLNACHQEDCLPSDLLFRLREVGQVFQDELFTTAIRDKILASKAVHLTVNIDDRLVQIPWELLHDGQQFLCHRFSMGRLVKTRQSTAGTRARLLEPPLKTLILADPRGDLKSAYDEGCEIRDFMEKNQDLLNPALLSANITPDAISSKFRNFDIVHFAGHADYNQENPADSGWLLSKGVMKAGDFMKMSTSGIMPALVFSNACQSARTEEWALTNHFHEQIFGLANALILSGVKHYIGTFWEILDEPGKKFALAFYKALFSGVTVGEAMHRARLSLIDTYGEESLVWASYLLYGDPTFNYMDQIGNTRPTAGPAAQVIRSAKDGDTTVEAPAEDDIITYSPEKPIKKSPWARVAGIAAAVAATILIALYAGVFQSDTTQQEQTLLAYYQNGQYEEAMRAAAELAEMNAKVRLSHLIQGNIFLRKGNLQAAQPAYTNAVEAPQGTELQKANALIGLGRLASLEKRPNDAMQYYQQAVETAPESSQGYLSQAMLLSRNGDTAAALDLLEKAQTRDPQDSTLAAITNQTRRQMELARDEQQQKRIDQLVQYLLENKDQPPRAMPTDGWTSQPLILWIMDFKTKGYSIQEGENALLLSGITEQLLEKGRVQIVERALLDKLLGELKLGSSELADRRTALAMGKLMAARLIVSGTIVYSGPHTQISLRIIETETGRIAAAINETVGSSVPVSELAGQLTSSLSDKIGEKYPIRGKIIKMDGNTAWMNIGANVGVVEGQTYKVVNQETALEVVAVASEESTVRIAENAMLPKEGQSVEVLYQ